MLTIIIILIIIFIKGFAEVTMDRKSSYSLFDVNVNPKTLTIITTYTCNAACKECCFECNPSIKHSLSFEEISQTITNAVDEYPSINLIVFTGGECFLLKTDLFKAIAFSSRLGKMTRCVSNGFWGKNQARAEEIAERVIDAGLSEINFSTGLDHQKWVHIKSVINACKALVKYDIPILVTIEKDSPESNCLSEILENNREFN